METPQKVNRKIWQPGKSPSRRRSETAALRRPPSRALLFVLFLAAVVLIPVVPGIVLAIHAETFLPRSEKNMLWNLPAPCVHFSAGFLAFALLFVFRRIPARTYVAVHEATHAVFGIMFGAKISKLRIGDESGSVDISRRNAAILLSPYFFPLPLVAVLGLRALCGAFVPLGASPAGIFFSVITGAAWSFHFCWTVNALLQWQTDLDAYGFFFSTVLLTALNAFVLWFALVSLLSFSPGSPWHDLSNSIVGAYLWTLDTLRGS